MKSSWIGTVQALWLDDFGFLREDDGDAVLEDYYTDPVIQQFFDEGENKTKIRRFVSTQVMNLLPFLCRARWTSYDSTTGTVTFEVDEISGAVGSGPYSDWTVYNLTTAELGQAAVQDQ